MEQGFTAIYNSIATRYFGEEEARSLYTVNLSTSVNDEGVASYSFCLRPREIGGALRVIEISPVGIDSIFSTKGLEGFNIGKSFDGLLLSPQSYSLNGDVAEISGTLETPSVNNCHLITPSSDPGLYSGLASILESFTKAKDPCTELWNEFGYPKHFFTRRPKNALGYIDYHFGTAWDYGEETRRETIVLMPQYHSPGISIFAGHDKYNPSISIDHMENISSPVSSRLTRIVDKRKVAKAERLLDEFFGILHAQF